jgi:hypothetical protein
VRASHLDKNDSLPPMSQLNDSWQSFTSIKTPSSPHSFRVSYSTLVVPNHSQSCVMETLSFSKSKWRVGKHSKKSKNCHCLSCHPTTSSRKQSKKLVERDLEEDYLKSYSPSQTRTRSAKAFVEWFYSRDEDDYCSEEHPQEGEIEPLGGIGPSKSLSVLGMDMEDEVFETMLKEHLEAEKLLERRKNSGGGLGQQIAEMDGSEEDWDLVSTGSTSATSTDGFGDWEEVEAH